MALSRYESWRLNVATRRIDNFAAGEYWDVALALQACNDRLCAEVRNQAESFASPEYKAAVKALVARFVELVGTGLADPKLVAFVS